MWASNTDQRSKDTQTRWRFSNFPGRGIIAASLKVQLESLCLKVSVPATQIVVVRFVKA